MTMITKTTSAEKFEGIVVDKAGNIHGGSVIAKVHINSPDKVADLTEARIAVILDLFDHACVVMEDSALIEHSLRCFYVRNREDIGLETYGEIFFHLLAKKEDVTNMTLELDDSLGKVVTISPTKTTRLDFTVKHSED